jgi:hypothetical protein
MPTRRFIFPLLLAIAVAITFGRTLRHEFVMWDDEQLIYHNPNLNPPTLDGLKTHWARSDHHLYIPVIYTTWWALAHIAPRPAQAVIGSALNPVVFHSANLCVHFLGVWVTFQILRKIVRQDWAAFAGAMVFAVHPVQVEPVAWATGMKDLLGGLLSLIALWIHMRWKTDVGSSALVAPHPGLRGVPLRPGVVRVGSVASVVVFILALLAKPSAVTLPLIAFAIDTLALDRPWHKALRALMPWIVLAVAATLWTMTAQPAPAWLGGPVWPRPIVAADALAFYLRKVAFPFPLTIDYGRKPAVLLSHPIWMATTWLVPVLVVVIVVRLRSRRIAAAGLVFLCGLLPVLGLTPFFFQYFSTVADRYLYVPMLGVTMALAWGISRRPTRFVGVVVGVGIAALMGTSVLQAGSWQDTVTLCRHAIDINPHTATPANLLGAALEARSDWPGAAREYQRAIDNNPWLIEAYVNLVRVDVKLGRPGEAADSLQRLVDVDASIPPELPHADVAGLRQTVVKLQQMPATQAATRNEEHP